MTTLNLILLIGYFAASGLDRLHRRRAGFDKPFVTTALGFWLDILFFGAIFVAAVLAILGVFTASDFMNVFFGAAIIQVSERILARHRQWRRADSPGPQLRTRPVEATAGSHSDS